MKEQEILDREEKHLQEPDGHRVIYLYKQGKFLRAYNYSAFLLNRKTPAEIKASSAPLKDRPKVFAGFPEESIDKFLAIEGAVRSADTDGNLRVVLPESIFESGETPETLAADCGNWMKCVPKTASSSGAGQKAEKTVLPTATVLSCVTEILHYPVEQKSLVENTEFLLNIRQKLIKLM